MTTIRLFRHYVHARLLLLGLFQLSLVMASVYVSAYIRFTDERIASAYTAHLFWRAFLVGLVVVLCMQLLGLYHRHLRDDGLRVALRILFSFVSAAILLAVLFYVFPSLYLGRGIMGWATALALCAIMATHRLAYSRFGNSAGRQRIVIYGAGNNAASILARLRRKADRRTFQLLGCIPSPNEEVRVESACLLQSQGDLTAFVAQQRADEIVVAMDERREVFPLRELLSCRLNGIQVTDMLTFYERHAGKVKTDLLHPSWFIFSDGFSQGLQQRYAKRVLDVLAASTLLALSWPLMLFATLLIWWEDGLRAPILYRQTRVGQYGRPFTILKFRSMAMDAEGGGQARWATRDDSRITRVGRYLRKYRIDELPQLINVLRGHMSFVGPRPERPEFVEELSRTLAFYELRHHVKPGITGWAQLCYPYGASTRDALEKLQFDLYYVKNGSLFLDLVIILGTVEVILFRKGAR